MSIRTQFTDRKTGEVVTLRDLDETMCEHQGIQPDSNRMCFLYDFICMVGIGVLANSEGSEVTEATLKEYLDRTNMDEAEHEVLRYYLVENYIFTAWRQHR